jgi:hypothetical protein
MLRERAAAAATAVVLLLVQMAFVASHLGLVHKPRRVHETDQYRYIEMAKGAGGDVALAREPPFCWRVLVPFVAGALTRTGIGLNGAFYLITNVSLLGFLFVLFVYLRQLGFPTRDAWLGMVLTGLMQGAVRWYEYQYWMTDPTCLLLLVGALYFVERGHLPAAGVLAAVAALVRETSMVLLPFVFVREWRRRSLSDALRTTALLAAMPLLILILLRVVVHPTEPVNLPAVLVDALSFRWRHLTDNQPYVLTVGTWGVLLPLALLSPRRLADWIRERPETLALVAAVYASLLLANNTDRLLAYAVPAVLPLAILGLDGLVTATGAPWILVAAAVVGLQVFVLVETRLFEMGVSIYQPTNLPVVAAMLCFWLAAEAARLFARRR